MTDEESDENNAPYNGNESDNNDVKLIQKFYEAKDDPHVLGYLLQGEGVITKTIKWIICCEPEIPFCSICRSPFEDRQEKWSTIICGHSFHTGCLMQWTKTVLSKPSNPSVTCPMCRHEYFK